MKSITTLVDDIHALAEGKLPVASYNTQVSVNYGKWFEERGGRKEKTLHFSEIGTPCLRKLWYNVNNEGVALPIDGPTRVKFLYGDMLEELVLSLARSANHEVVSEQAKVFIPLSNGWQITGRIDAIIDGVLVDVKSTTKFGEKKFENGLKDDPFGYKMQLAGYAEATAMKEAGFVTIQKELGHIKYFPMDGVDENKKLFHMQADLAVEAVESEIHELPRLLPVKQSDTSSNMKLCTTCSYCAYRKECWPSARTFIYSSGPEHLVHIDKLPKVVEIV